MTHLILDGIFAIIVLIGLFIGIKKGAVKIILSLVAFVLAAYLAYFLATPVACYINERFVTPSISNSVYESMVNGNEPSQVLPDFILENANKLGADLDGIGVYDSITLEQVTDYVEEHLAPFFENLLTTVSIIALFIIFSIIFNLIVSLLNKLIKNSLLGGINSFLGAVFGALNGCVIVAVICLVLSIAVKYTPSLPFNITEETHNSSIFFGLFDNIF